jgi:hypothetical protein
MSTAEHRCPKGLSKLAAKTAMALIVAAGLVTVARAAPPTVTPSPGYDARLQEQRKAMSISPLHRSAGGERGQAQTEQLDAAFDKAHPECQEWRTRKDLPKHCY